jgi:hypothetical protein
VRLGNVKRTATNDASRDNDFRWLHDAKLPDTTPSYRLSEAAIRWSRHVGYAREAQPLLLVMKFCQRIGDFLVGRAGKGSRKACSCHVEEGTADAAKLAAVA